jgi:hypothetical protein
MKSFPTCAGYLVFALVIAGPTSAQQIATATSPHTSISLAEATKTVSKQAGMPAGYLKSGYQKYCGADFGCYTGIPLRCASNTRPYQDVAAHQCFCLPDGCPQ